jgi:hypothetical protein
MPAKKEVNKVMKAAISKKPAAKQGAALNPTNIALARLKKMTLEEKMNAYQNNKRLNQDGNVDAFLNVLDAGDRQAIWSTYNYSRKGSTAASEQYTPLQGARFGSKEEAAAPCVSDHWQELQGEGLPRGVHQDVFQ